MDSLFKSHHSLTLDNSWLIKFCNSTAFEEDTKILVLFGIRAMWLAVIPLGICGLKNNSRRITYGIECVLGMPSLSPLSSLGRSPLSDFEAHTLQNDFVVFFRLGVKGESGQTLFSSLEALTFKIQGKTVSTILVDHDFCQIAWLDWFNSGIRIKYDRTCKRAIKIISM